MIVEIWSDVVCPWCYIGKRRFEAALAAFAEAHPDADVEVHYRAFMLDPGAPHGISQSVREVYEKKFGGPDQAEAMMNRVSAEAAGEGLNFRLDIAQRTNTDTAHRLLALAEQEGRQIELVERLFAAYFTEGRPLATVEDLTVLAAEIGMEAETVRAWLSGDGGREAVDESLEFAARNGLSGVPTFVFDREFAVAGAQNSDALVEMLERRLAASTTA